jgi:hypothetical protein
MANKYRVAPDVQKVVDRLIRTESRFADLAKHRYEIRCFFCEEAEVSKGHAVIGSIRRIGGLQAFLINHDPSDDDYQSQNPMLVIIIHGASWSALSERHREALCFHELCHTKVTTTEDGEARLSLVGHDIEDFFDVVQKYGNWQPSVQQFVKAAQVGQGMLNLEPGGNSVELFDKAEDSGDDEGDDPIGDQKISQGEYDGLVPKAIKLALDKGRVPAQLLAKSLRVGVPRAEEIHHQLVALKVIDRHDVCVIDVETGEQIVARLEEGE